MPVRSSKSARLMLLALGFVILSSLAVLPARARRCSSCRRYPLPAEGRPAGVTRDWRGAYMRRRSVIPSSSAVSPREVSAVAVQSPWGRPSDREARTVLRVLDGLLESFCSGDTNGLVSRVAGRGTSLDRCRLRHSAESFHRSARSPSVHYEVQCLRKKGRIVEAAVDWTLDYIVAATGERVRMRGTTAFLFRLGRKGPLLCGRHGSLLFELF